MAHGVALAAELRIDLAEAEGRFQAWIDWKQTAWSVYHEWAEENGVEARGMVEADDGSLEFFYD